MGEPASGGEGAEKRKKDRRGGKVMGTEAARARLDPLLQIRYLGGARRAGAQVPVELRAIPGIEIPARISLDVFLGQVTLGREEVAPELEEAPPRISQLSKPRPAFS